VARPGRALQPIEGHAVRILVLDRRIAAAAGDRFALRLPAPVGTVGAGRVLDPLPPRGPARRRASAERLGALMLARDAAALDAASLELHGAIDGEPPRLAGDVQSLLEGVAEQAVEAHRAKEPSSAGLLLGELRLAVARAAQRQAALSEAGAARVADRVVDDLISRGTLARSGERVASPSSAASIPAALRTAMERLELALDVALPPPLAEAARAAGCPPEGVAALARSGRITRLADDLAWSAAAYGRLAARALAMATRGPLSPAAFRDATGTSRRYVLAILEDLDRRGILRRTPDGHVPGPRAPR
jgi:selenocysteine-specific elongation factor